MAEPDTTSYWDRFTDWAKSTGLYVAGKTYSLLPEGGQEWVREKGLEKIRAHFGEDTAGMMMYALTADPNVDALAKELSEDPQFKSLYEQNLAKTQDSIRTLLAEKDDPESRRLLEQLFGGAGENLDALTERMVENAAKKFAVASTAAVREDVLANQDAIKNEVIPKAFAEKAKDPESWCAARDHWLWGTLLSIASYFTGRSVEELALWADNGFSEEATKAYAEKFAEPVARRVVGENRERILTNTATTLLRQGMPASFVATSMIEVETALRQQVEPGYAPDDAEKAALLARFQQQVTQIAQNEKIPVTPFAASDTDIAQGTPPPPSSTAAGVAPPAQAAAPAGRSGLARNASQNKEFGPSLISLLPDSENKLKEIVAYNDLGTDTERMVWIKDHFPDAKFTRDENGTLLIAMPDGKSYYDNAPGFSNKDVDSVGSVVASIFIWPLGVLQGAKALSGTSIIPQAQASELNALPNADDATVVKAVQDGLKEIHWLEEPVIPDAQLAGITRKVISDKELDPREQEALRKAGLTAEDIAYALAALSQQRTRGQDVSRNETSQGLQYSDAGMDEVTSPPVRTPMTPQSGGLGVPTA